MSAKIRRKTQKLLSLNLSQQFDKNDGFDVSVERSSRKYDLIAAN